MDYTCRNTIIQNMKDFGCEDEIIESFLACVENKDKAGQERIMKAYRERLLEELHQSQKKIDLLDYMMYQLEKCRCE